MSLVLRNLFKDKTRFALSVGGVALAVMLILLLNGFLGGMNAQITAYLTPSPGTLVVAQEGVRNLLGATSLLPPGVDGDVKAKGTSEVIPILSQFIILDLHEKKQRHSQNRRRNSSARARRDELSAGHAALSKREMMANDLKLFARIFSAPLQLMVGIAFLAGALIVGLVIYTAALARRAEYGVLKALGARSSHLYGAVLTQALLSVGLGFGAGLVFTLGLSAIAPGWA